MDRLSTKDVAERLGVSYWSVRNYVRRGELPAERIRSSRLLRFRAEDVERLLQPAGTGSKGKPPTSE